MPEKTIWLFKRISMKNLYLLGLISLYLGLGPLIANSAEDKLSRHVHFAQIPDRSEWHGNDEENYFYQEDMNDLWWSRSDEKNFKIYSYGFIQHAQKVFSKNRETASKHGMDYGSIYKIFTAGQTEDEDTELSILPTDTNIKKRHFYALCYWAKLKNSQRGLEKKIVSPILSSIRKDKKDLNRDVFFIQDYCRNNSENENIDDKWDMIKAQSTHFSKQHKIFARFLAEADACAAGRSEWKNLNVEDLINEE